MKSQTNFAQSFISVWGSFMCRKSTTRDPRLYFPSKGSITQNFYSLRKSIDSGRIWTLRTSDPVASMITTRPLGSTNIYRISLDLIYISLTLNRFLWGWQLYIIGHRLGIPTRPTVVGDALAGREEESKYYFLIFLFYLFIFIYLFCLLERVRSLSSTPVNTPLVWGGWHFYRLCMKLLTVI